MPADYAHTAAARANRETKAKLLYWQLVLAGQLEVPTDPKVRLYLRKGAGLDRAPSEETWALAGELLAAWPPVVMRAAWDQQTGPCGCHVDPDTRMLFEELPRDRETGRFQGWPCPHNSPAHLGCRPPDRFPAVSQNDRAEVAAAVVIMRAAQHRKAAAAPAAAPPQRDGLQTLAGAGFDVRLDEALPPDVVELRHADGTVARRITGVQAPAVPPAGERRFTVEAAGDGDWQQVGRTTGEPAPAADPDDWWA